MSRAVAGLGSGIAGSSLLARAENPLLSAGPENSHEQNHVGDMLYPKASQK